MIIVFNIIIFIVFILLTRYTIIKNRKENKVENKIYIKKNRNDIIDILINSYKQPTVFLNKHHEVISYNESFNQLFQVDNLNEYLNNLDYVKLFIRGGHTNRRIEIEINGFDYYVDLDKIDSSHLKGIIITYSDISSLKSVYKAQDEYLNDIKHELKTPITAIIGLSDLLVNQKIDNKEDYDKILKTINSESHRLNGLIGSLTSSISEKPKLTKIDLSQLFDELELIYNNKSEVGLIFENYVENNITCDKEILKQVLINLVDNALKYTESGYVKVSSIQVNNTIKIAVVDTGVGISKEDLNNIFDRFYRVDKSRSKESGGYGLGLSIIKSLLEKIDAGIEVTSIYGQGSTFTIILKVD